jgi:glycosyltransferase involved in cell wall biosynthesis
MQIAIDAHHLGQRRTGSETYVYKLVRHLALLEPNGDRYVVYLNPRQSVEGVKSNPCFQTRAIPTWAPPFRFGVYFPMQSWRKSFDVFHTQFSVPPFLSARAVLTVFDLAFERFPEFFRPTIRMQMKLLVPWSCRRAEHVIAVSESSKRDLVEIYELDPSRITVTYEGPSEIYGQMDVEQAKMRLRKAHGIKTPFVLYVGNLDPRKNLSRLLEAFAQLKRNDRVAHKLVIVGQKGWLYDGIFETVRNNSLDQEVLLTGYVPSADLPAFYSAASAMIYPSFYEGFGLPVVEAMACGTPVITSLGSSLEEIASGAAVLVDPYSISSIATAIKKVANSVDLQRDLREAGLAPRGPLQLPHDGRANAIRLSLPLMGCCSLGGF